MSVLDQASHVVACLKDRQVGLEAFLKLLKALFFEAGEAAVEHERDEVQELLAVLSDCQVSLNRACYIELIGLGLVVPAEDVDEFLGELEVRALKAHVFAWRPVKDKAKVNVNYMASIVNHDVAIMAVLDLKDVAHDRVGRETLNEVEASHLELSCVLVSELLKEVLVEINLERLAELVSAVGVRHALDDAAEGLVIASTVAYALVGRNKEV